MINDLSIEKAIAILKPNMIAGSFEEKYIPSKDVRVKIGSEKWVFSDRDKATIIWNAEKQLPQKYADLIKIMQETDDKILKEQISERIRYEAIALKLFSENKEGFVYVAKDCCIGEETINGYFSTMELAYDAGKREGKSFTIEKHQIIGEDTVKIKQWSMLSPILTEDVDKQIEEIDIPGSPVASMTYDEKGVLTDFCSYEGSKEDTLLVDSLGRHRFENAYVVLPNPFELGEYVRLVGDTMIGRVDVSQEEWSKCVKRALEPDALDDYFDASIIVRYNDQWEHSHLNPLYLERVTWDADYYSALKVIAGHDFENAYWLRPVKVKDEGEIYLNEVEELDPEISIPEEHVSGIVLEIFKEHLDMELSYNDRRVRYDYDPNGQKVSGFGMDMIHNFYAVDHIEKMAYNLIAVSLYLCDSQYFSEETDISKEVLCEIEKYDAKISGLDRSEQIERKWEYAKFLRDVADRLMEMIDYGKNKEMIISIMAP